MSLEWQGFPWAGRGVPQDFQRALLSGNPSEQPCQPFKNLILPSSLTCVNKSYTKLTQVPLPAFFRSASAPLPGRPSTRPPSWGSASCHWCPPCSRPAGSTSRGCELQKRCGRKGSQLSQLQIRLSSTPVNRVNLRITVLVYKHSKDVWNCLTFGLLPNLIHSDLHLYRVSHRLSYRVASRN